MIPQTLTKFFWDTDIKSLNISKHERMIVYRVLNYGTLSDWNWLAHTYGKKHIADMLKVQGRTSIREPVARLAGVLFA